MARLLLLIPTASYRTHDFIAAAERLGVEVVVGSDQESVLADLGRGATLALDFDDIEGSTERILALGVAFDAIVPVDGGGVAVAAAAAERLGLPQNSPDAITVARNKYYFRCAVAAAGLPAPDFRLVPLDADPAAVAREVGFPCVLKPLTLAMSRGVIRADGHNSFVEAFHRVAAIIARPDAKTPGIAADHLLVESYVPGTEYALEGLMVDGRLELLAIFDKPDPLEGPYFEETIYVAPALVSERRRQAIQATADKALRALGLIAGPTHIDLRVDDDETVTILELDARSIGGRCGRSLRFGEGLRLEDVILRQAAGLPIPSFAQSGAGGVMMIPIPASGTLRGVAGIAAAEAVPLVSEVSITIPVGDAVEMLPEASRYLGFIIAHGETPAAVVAALRQAHAALSFDIG
jgi:biotin carboxylase